MDLTARDTAGAASAIARSSAKTVRKLEAAALMGDLLPRGWAHHERETAARPWRKRAGRTPAPGSLAPPLLRLPRKRLLVARAHRYEPPVLERERGAVRALQLAPPPRPGRAPRGGVGEAVVVEPAAHVSRRRFRERILPEQRQHRARAFEQALAEA